MNQSNENVSPPGIPEQILEKFLKQLESDKIPAVIIERLKNAIDNVDGVFDVAVKAALFPEEQAL